MTTNALNRGTLSRPTRCQRCKKFARRDPRGGRQLIRAHHEDYAKPFEIVWLCGSCHQHRHQEIRRAAMAQGSDA